VGLRRFVNHFFPRNNSWLVVITNVYPSAGGSTRLRGGYGDYDQRLEAPEDTYSGFFTEENLKLFDKLAPSWGAIFTDLPIMIVAPINSFREYVSLSNIALRDVWDCVVVTR